MGKDGFQKNPDGTVSLSAGAWQRLLLLLEGEKGWTEEDVVDAIGDRGWIRARHEDMIREWLARN